MRLKCLTFNDGRMNVNPADRNIDQLFGTTTYYIDFYQRQYKWTEEPVKKLLDDIFYKFNDEYNRYKNFDIDIDKVIDNYGWYYLNTFVTNKVSGKDYVVDGQQRLTTLSLILMKLRLKSIALKSKLSGWIDNKIAGCSGYKQNFWMNHEGSLDTIESIYQNGIIEKPLDDTITSKNLVDNYKTISIWLDRELPDSDLKRFDTFVFYFLKRLVLIRLEIEQTDVPMVFEVINDRGVRLKPYEILKGKLLGQIQKIELDSLQLNDLWDNIVNKINSIYEDEIDRFFTYYLKAKFADTRTEGRKFDNDYHRSIMSIPSLGLVHNEKNVKRFLLNDFVYYANLYFKIRRLRDTVKADYIYLYYNGLTQMDTQFLLILSSCSVNDCQEDEKIKQISYEVDRLFCLLQLQRSYDSNLFASKVYEISVKIRNCHLSDIRGIFDEVLLSVLQVAHGNIELNSVWNYSLFKNVGIDLDKRFLRYILARVEQYIADNTKMNMKQNLYNLVINRGAANGFHIEHILAENTENHQLFGNDEERFRSERNRLGGLLLMKGSDNISSSNELYEDKLKSYSNTLYWNETLREDSYKSKLDFTKWIAVEKLNFRPMYCFGPQELEERHRLLSELIQRIWR